MTTVSVSGVSAPVFLGFVILGGASPLAVAQAERDEVTVLGTREREERESYVVKRSRTGTKSDTPAQEVPFALTSITRALIDDQRPLSVGEALRNVAGYQPQPGFGGLNSRPRIRGFIPPSFLKDGFRQSVFVTELDLATVAQIEVLKGPASALYGRFEPGGAVNIVSKKPLEDFEANLQVVGGSDAYYRGTLDVGGPIVDRTLLYRLNAVYEDADSYRDLFAQRKILAAPSVEWRMGDDTSVLTQLQYTYRDGGFDRGFIVPATANLGAALLALPVNRNLGEPTDATVYHGFTGSTIVDHRLSGSWRLRVGAFWSEASLQEQFFTSGAPLMPDATTYNRRNLFGRDDERDYTLGAEVSGVVRIATLDHRVLLGVDGGDTRYKFEAWRVPQNSPLNILNPVYGRAVYAPATTLAFAGENLQQAFGAFVQDEIALGARWRILAGARFDSTRGTNEVTGSPSTVSRRTVQAVSPRLGITFMPVPSLSLYASYAESFSPEVTGVLAGGRMTEPSSGEQYEAGIKTQWLEGRLVATAAYYDITKGNVVVADPENPGFSIQVGEQTSRGVELELAAELQRGWNVIASIAHSTAEISADTNASLVGNRIVNVPEDTASLWTRYRFNAGALAGLQVGAGAFHVGDRAVNNANLFFLPSYTRFDATVGYSRDQWDFALNLQNISDEKYFDSAGGVFHPMPPRQWFVTLGRRY